MSTEIPMVAGKSSAPADLPYTSGEPRFMRFEICSFRSNGQRPHLVVNACKGEPETRQNLKKSVTYLGNLGWDDSPGTCRIDLGHVIRISYDGKMIPPTGPNSEFFGRAYPPRRH
jgi:hypothetical protein